ncbi:MAG: response regulator transcription factor [Chloroflexi bacterium]|nr:response regulator transcription factor [Chloroflexota bacterium]
MDARATPVTNADRNSFKSMTTIVLADDHHIVRAGLRLVLEEVGGFKVVGEAADGHEAVKVVESLKPDVLVVDITMPGMDGLEVTRRVVHDSPSTRVVVLSIHRSQAHVEGAFTAGAHAYVIKGASPDELETAIRETLSGHRYVSRHLLEEAEDASRLVGIAGRAEPRRRLNGREEDLIGMLAEGMTSADISARLSLSPRTVDTYCKNLMIKLGLSARAQLINYAVKRRIAKVDAETAET